MNKFKPEMYYKSVFDINYELLKKNNIKAIIFDLDNTIMTIGEELPNERIVNLFKKISNDFQIFIASNNFKDRVKKIGKYLNVYAFYSVGKPTKKLKKLLLNKYDVKMEEVVIVGDQILTDILMGNRLNMHTILVDPLGKKDLKVTYINRLLEKIINKKNNLKRGEYYEKIL